jgi:transposase
MMLDEGVSPPLFIDETWAKTNMTRTHGRSPRGERLLAKVPHGRWRTLTFIAALRHDRITAPIEQMFSKLKTLLRKADERSVEATWRRIGSLLDYFTPDECRNYLVNSGYAST